jgi:hypothetical protein
MAAIRRKRKCLLEPRVAEQLGAVFNGRHKQGLPVRSAKRSLMNNGVSDGPSSAVQPMCQARR